jgi:hypothetical protein
MALTAADCQALTVTEEINVLEALCRRVPREAVPLLAAEFGYRPGLLKQFWDLLHATQHRHTS